MSPLLMDRHQRIIEYLRVSITDLCNLRCVYCRPPEGVKLVSHSDILRYEEILRIVKVACGLGIRKIRVTGGEPLVRRDVLDFISRLSATEGLDDLGLTTNGVLLAAMAEDLKSAGLTRINVSLDSLRRDTFAEITGSDRLPDVLAGMEKALEVGLNPVKINVVLLQGINEPDVPAFATMTMEMPVDVRFIERMPFAADGEFRTPDPFSSRKVMEIITNNVGPLHPVERQSLDGPASMFSLKGARGRIGIIDPLTGHFCGTCNRLRLTARGTLRPCLLSPREIDVKSVLRYGASDAEIADTIIGAVLEKPSGHAGDGALMRDGMNTIGG